MRRPDVVPASPTDLKTPRFSVRSNGDAGFIFMNNHVRQYAMASQQGVRYSVKLPGGKLVFPSKPVDVADGDDFIWPFNLDLDGVKLRWASAQPLARIDGDKDAGKDGVTYVFAAHKHIAPELVFDASLGDALKIADRHAAQRDGRLVVDGIVPGTAETMTVRVAAGGWCISWS